MRAEQAARLCLIIRQANKVIKDSLDNLTALAESSLMIFVDDEIERQNLLMTKREDHLLNIKELAKRLGVSIRTINNLKNEGMPTIKLMNRTVFDYEDISVWMKERKMKSRSGRKNKLSVVK